MANKAIGLNVVRIEPAFVGAEGGAVFLGQISKRTFHEIVAAEEIPKIKIPNVRRTLYAIDDLRKVADRWRRA